MTLTVSQVKALRPNLLNLSDEVLQTYIDTVTAQFNEDVYNIFASPAVTITQADCYNFGVENTTGSNIVKIRAWQPTGLTIVKTHIKNSDTTVLTETPLVIGQDYIYGWGFSGKKIPGFPQPVTYIQLLKSWMTHADTLRVYGTYGFQLGYPQDVIYTLCNVIVWIANVNNSLDSGSGTGIAVREQDLTSEVEFSELQSQEATSASLSFTDIPQYRALVSRYQFLDTNYISII